MTWLEMNRRTATLKAWQARRDRKGVVVTADEMIARMRRNWPTLTSEEIDQLYQASA